MSLTGLSLILLSLAPTGAVQAKDSSHTGAAYLQVELDPGSHRIQSNVSYSPIGNAWFGQDVTKSPEWMTEKISWSPESWKFTGALLDSGSVDKAIASVASTKDMTTGKYWSPTKTADSFKAETLNLEKTDDGRGNLALTFPGWAAADRVFVLNKDGTHSKGIDRNDDKTSDEFKRIDSKNAATAAGRVNETLVSELNRALEDNYGQLVTSKGKRNPDLSTEGFMNLLWATVGGKFPETGKTWTYNEVDYSIDTSGSVQIKSILAKDVWNQKSATDKLLQIYPNRKGAVKSEAYTYAVPKGYHAGVGSGATVDNGGKRGSDLYAITWFDIAMGATSATVRSEKKESDDSNSTVVGEQVDNWFYKALSALVSTLGVRNADELVFGEWGNLFKNNTFPMFMAVQTPFIILAFMILSVAVVNAIRRSAKDYLSVGDVRSIQDVFGQAINAVLMIIFLNVILFGAIYLNGALVKIAAQISHFMKTLQTNGFSNTGDNAVSSFFANILGASGITSLLVSFVLVGINIKFTWRYVARAISFGIYFVIAPVVFALDALKGDGRLLNFGSGTANIMKNLIGLVFQQALDALGIAFAINVGRIIFGNGVIVTILGFLSIEAITNALMGMFGVQAGSIRGIAEAGQTWHQKGMEGLKRAGAFLGGAMAAKGYAAVKSGRNRDDEAILRKQHERANAENPTSGSSKEKGKLNNDLDQEAQVSAYKAKEFGEVKPKVQTNNDLDQEVNNTTNSNWDTLKGELGDLKNSAKQKAQGVYDGAVSTGWGSAISNGSSKLFGAFTEGATNRGVHGDPNTTVDQAVRVSGMDSRLNPNNYKIDNNGNVVAKGIKGRMQRTGRDIGRFIGGATLGMVSDPKYGMRTMMGAAAGGLSAVTPGKFDDMVATVANIQNYESALTGGNTQSFGSRFAKSWVGRMAGAQGMNWDVQNVSAQSMFEQPSQAGYTVAGISGESSDGVSMYTSPIHDDTEEMVLRTSWGEGEGNKEQKDIHSAMNELTSFENNPNGSHSFSRSQLSEMTGDAVKGQYAQQVLNYMDKSGMENIHFEHGKVSVDQQMVRDAGTFVKEDDPKAHSALAVAKAKYGEGGLYHDHETGAVIKQSLDSGKPMAFVPKSFANGGNNYAIKQRELDVQSLRKAKMDDSKRLELTKKAFSVSPSEYQDFRQTHFTKELTLDGDKK